MKRPAFLLALLAVCVASAGSTLGRAHALAVRSVLPSTADAKTLLDATTRHREWVNLATDSSGVFAFVVWPERADRAPAVLITARGDSADVRSRAVADQLAAEGFIGVAAETSSRVAAETYASHLPAADGSSAWLDIDFAQSHAQVVTNANGAVGHF
ncbi:MAG TPA: hypothetical protein VKB36_15890, partial [Vicinamibacterales bacterium]|nr:hypothetical protein [Vicinamibacterales bacterium]